MQRHWACAAALLCDVLCYRAARAGRRGRLAAAPPRASEELGGVAEVSEEAEALGEGLRLDGEEGRPPDGGAGGAPGQGVLGDLPIQPGALLPGKVGRAGAEERRGGVLEVAGEVRRNGSSAQLREKGTGNLRGQNAPRFVRTVASAGTSVQRPQSPRRAIVAVRAFSGRSGPNAMTAILSASRSSRDQSEPLRGASCSAASATGGRSSAGTSSAPPAWFVRAMSAFHDSCRRRVGVVGRECSRGGVRLGADGVRVTVFRKMF